MTSHRGRSVLTGLTGGFFSGLTGAGGGIVMVPLLTSLLRMPQHRAHGTSLVIVIFVATAGLIGYWRADNVEWSLAVWLAMGSGLGAYAGAVAMSRLAPRALRFTFGLFLVSVAVRMFII
ncbi:MAG: sulfite exporter TauE/SafE family protein [Chloroflexi bacterium]|nr:sulfite exporter TauE/SafE family protein [Chloroflexota bacterium]